jgi:hypothetical protein
VIPHLTNEEIARILDEEDAILAMRFSRPEGVVEGLESGFVE